MTSPRFRAEVHWLSPADGGRSALPAAVRYSTVSRFIEDEDWPDGDVWSVFIEFDRPPSDENNPSPGWVEFLSPEAPHGRLRPGRSFDLYEGPRRVASVSLLGNTT